MLAFGDEVAGCADRYAHGCATAMRVAAIHDHQDPAEGNHMGILERSLLVEPRGMVAGGDN
jgi:hypothetical protein